MQELSAISQMRLHYNQVDAMSQLKSHDKRLADLHAKQVEADDRQERKTVTTAQQLRKMLELHYKNSAPIDIWV